MKLRSMLALVLALVLGFGSLWAANPKHKGTVKVPARIHVSANFEGELEPCGWKVKKGGLARRAGFLTQARVDTVANITVEAGNFAPQSRNRGDSIKVRAVTDFYRDLHYDAVGLSSREIGFGIGMWQDAAKDGVPVVAANVCKDKRGKKPVFEPYIIKKDHGDRFGIIGFVSESAWRAYSDTTRKLYLKSPFEMGKLIRKVAKKCDHLTVIGEFTTLEADSLIRTFPEINVVVSSGIRSDQVTKVGNSLIVGSSTRGNVASYVDWNYTPADTALIYANKQQTLDPTVPEDTTVVRLLSKMNETIKAPPDKH